MSSVARRFHDETVHTPCSVRTSGHTLDWDNKPFPFKIYTDAPGSLSGNGLRGSRPSGAT